MEFEFSVQIIDKFIGGGLVFIYLAAFLIFTGINPLSMKVKFSVAIVIKIIRFDSICVVSMSVNNIKKLNRPLFIIGNPRSGTSLLRLILTSHSCILIPPECGFIIWLHKKYANWQTADNNNVIRVNLFLNDLLACKKFDTWSLNRTIIEAQIQSNKPETYAELCRVVYSSFGFIVGKNFDIWGDKNNFYLNHLNELLNLYNDARFLHLVRDGRDVACSYREVMAVPSNSPYAPILETRIADIALEWSSNVMKIDSFLSTMLDEATMTIRYEDLVLNPLSVVMEICKWLNLPFEAEMLNFYQQNKIKKLEPDLTLDWKKRTLQPISEATVSRYTSLLNNEEQSEFLTVATTALQRFSYV